MSWFIIIHEGNYHISASQLDAKSKNLLFFVVAQGVLFFVVSPPFFKELLSRLVTSNSSR